MAGNPKPGVQERILLHLRDYSDYRSSVEVPFALSQMGIANAVAIARSNVPRAIAGLRDQGLLVERQAHVKGVSRKRKAYFLTTPGVVLADETWKRLRDYKFRVIQEDNSTDSTTLGEAHKILPFQMRSVDIIRYLDDSGILDVRNLNEDLVQRDLSKHVEKQLVTSLGDLPRLRHFYGRERELDNMVNLIDARSTTLMIPGIAGIGKTTMASKLIERFKHRRNLLYHRCQDWDGYRSFYDLVAEWLANIGDSSFADYVAATPVPNPADAARLIVDCIGASPSLIVIDDYHKVADSTLHQTIQALSLAMIENEEQIGLVIFSRSFKSVVPKKDTKGNIATLVIPLDGLDFDSAKNLITGSSDLSPEQWAHIHGLTRGHPLVLELINRGANTGAYHETLENYVQVEIFSKLSAEQKRVLSAIAIYREPIPLEALADQKLDTDILASLVESGLARQADAETFDVHDLIREFLLQSLDSQVKQNLHSKCVEWYSKQKEDHALKVELIYHQINSGKEDEAMKVLVESGRELVGHGHMEILALIDAIPRDKVEDTHVAQVKQLKGEILTLQGRLDEAKTVLDELKENMDDSNPRINAEVISALADIARKQERIDDALSMQREALNLFMEISDEVGAARTYNNMGYLLRRKREKSKALEAYSQVEEILKQSGNKELIGSQINLARALLELGELEKAREHAINAFETSQDNNNPIVHARAQAVLGRYYSKMQDHELALHHYGSAVEVMDEAGDLNAFVEIIVLLGEVFEDSGKTEEALEKYREALAIAEANDLRMQVGDILAKLGDASPSHQRMEYLKRALLVFRELGATSKARDVQNLFFKR